ncbi:MAG: protein kinase family protein [Paludibacteraceae bacterium]|nr:protein kinase family protein [Paludibacteraceae bacterium]
MNYPLISEYIEAIKAAEANFEELTNLRAVLGEDGQPVMNAGGFSVVFKMEDKETGKYYALKCFTKEQKGRAEAYHQIAEELKDVDSPYLISIRYLDKELFVDTNQTSETEFPVLLMDWIDGKPFDKYLRQNLKKKKTLEKFLSNFYQLVKWLIAQPFAHGDLKPDNILVKKDGNLVLVDYDGMYVPDMSGQKSREMGSPDFCHPQRNEDTFDEHIDDFSILSILLSLCVFFVKPSFWGKYGAEDRLLFSKNDYVDICKSNTFRSIPSIIETSTNYKSLFEKACKDLNFQLKMKSLTPINKLFTAITLQEESKEKLRKETETRTVNDIEVTFCAIRTEIDAIEPNFGIISTKPKVQPYTDNVDYQRKILEQEKREKATKWQAALLVNITIILLVIIGNVNSRNSEILPAVGWGLCLGLPIWYFCFFDYIKRDGSYGNCFFAFVLFPITIYYGIYSCICMCINYFKEWRNKA